MPSPFPGMDPYIEAQANWMDFHNSLIIRIRDALGLSLPENYVPRSDERIEVVNFAEREAEYRPDVLITRDPVPKGSGTGTATLTLEVVEPVAVAMRSDAIEDEHVLWVEISRPPDLELVTVIEILSPSNKQRPGHENYLKKRQDLVAAGVNLVEIDLLLNGLRPPMAKSLDSWDYVAVVARAERKPVADVYGWSIQRPLPPIPIPLKPPDPDVWIDLGPMATQVYETGRYHRTIRYDRPLPEGTRLLPEDLAWAATFGTPASRPEPRPLE